MSAQADAPKPGMPQLPEPVSSQIPVEAVRKPGTKSSAYRGVTLFRPTMKWRAQVRSAEVVALVEWKSHEGGEAFCIGSSLRFAGQSV